MFLSYILKELIKFLQLDKNYKYDKDELKTIYGYNYLKNNLCEQILLSTNVITDKMKYNGISSSYYYRYIL